MAAKAPSSQDLLIVGPGVLGSYLGKLWKDQHPDTAVVGQTNTINNHEMLAKLGISPRVKADAAADKYPFVVFAAPPSGSEDYVAEIKGALSRWDGTGAFVFTGSAGVMDADAGACDEATPLVQLGAGERTDRLLNAEAAVLEAGGNVIRFVGLYHARRGAHTFFISQGQVARSGSYVVNLIHYEDAADMTRAVLEGSGSDDFYRGRAFVGSDDTPITFQDMIAACAKTGAFEGADAVEFTGTGGPEGKRVTSKQSKQTLQWQPKYSGFAEFMQETGATDFYSSL